VPIGDRIHHDVTPGAGIDTHRLQLVREPGAAAEDRSAGALDDLAFEKRIEPAMTGLVDVEIDDVPDASQPAGADADEVADDKDAIIGVAGATQEGERGRNGRDEAAGDVL